MLGDRVKALREARAWTQEHLAEAAGVSLRTIQRLENGSGFASETALAVAAAFPIDVRELLDGGAGPTYAAFDRPVHLLIPARLARKLALVAALAMSLPTTLFAMTYLLRHYAGFATPDFQMLDSPLVVIGPPLALLILWRSSTRRPRANLEIRLPIAFR